VRKFLLLMIIVSLGVVVGCGGSGGTPAGVPTGGGGGTGTGNVQPIAVDGGPIANQIYPNGAFTSVTLCNPGTTTCQTIDGILVDTGSFGLRVLSSAITLTGLQTLQDGNNNTLYNCINFADSSYLWGAAEVADVQMAGELASSVTIQVIADPAAPNTFTIPTGCSNGGIDEDTQAGLGTNGILGVGPEPTDCGLFCDPTGPNGGGAAPEQFYYLCSTTTCATTFVSCGSCGTSGTPNQQVANPVALFANDNNGVIVQLPSLTGAAATETGSLIFGIGTQTNNQVPSSALIFALDSEDTFSTTYQGVTYNSTNNTPSFIDSGSNGLFFPDTITACAPPEDSFYCPGSVLNRSAVNKETVPVTNATSTVNFSIDNADTLFNADGGTDAAFSTLGGPNPGGGFDFGLPFFYGRSVFTSIDGAPVPSGTPPAPWWAY
jgi:hypothetical protein